VRGETVFDEKVSGHVLDTYEIPVDTYSLVASCAVSGTTGTLTVVPLDRKEWEKHSDTLQETLDRMDQSLKDALGNVGIAVG
jgi:phenylacetate-coenzyme A ligase PaaK-like adenylate-forming protein